MGYRWGLAVKGTVEYRSLEEARICRESPFTASPHLLCVGKRRPGKQMHAIDQLREDGPRRWINGTAQPRVADALPATRAQPRSGSD